ncbi:MAG: hypothetical protein R3Y64_08015 [Peptostreptococcaceae bacterium]
MKEDLSRIVKEYCEKYSEYRSNINEYIKISNRFLNFMGDTISNVGDLELKHFQMFIDNKSKYCNISTIKKEACYLKVIIKMINKIRSTNIDIEIKMPHCKNKAVKDKAMKDRDIRILLNTYDDHWHFVPVSIKLADKLGLRVSECTKIKCEDINLTEKIIMINCAKTKNKKTMTIEDNDFEFFTTLKHKLGEKNFLSVNPGSINNNIRKHLKLCNLNKKYEITNLHAIRKNFAQRKFNECRSSKFNKEESLKIVSTILRHSIFSYKVIKAYVLHIY